MLTLRAVRYGGFLAAALLVVAGWAGGGALPDSDLAATPVSTWTGRNGPFVMLAWLAGTVGLTVAWWAVRDRVPGLRWAAVTIVLWMVPFLVAPPMGSRDVYSYACQGDLFRAGLDPYTTGVSALPCPWLETVAPIWRDTPAPYGVLFVLIAAGAVLLGGSLTVVIVLLRLAAVAGVAVTALCLPVLARRCGVPPERALWVALAGPVVGLHLIGGPHNDALMIGAVVAGLALLVSLGDRPAVQLTAGAVLGLALAVKITAVVVVPFAALVAVGATVRPGSRPGSGGTAADVPITGPRRSGARSGPGFRLGSRPGPGGLAALGRLLASGWPAMSRVAGGALVSLTAVTLASGLGVGWIAGLTHTQDLVQFTSPPTAVGMTLTYLLPVDAVPTLRLLALVLLAVTLVYLWWRSATTDGDRVVAALSGAALATTAMIALAPSFHPWYVCLPVVLLAVTGARTGPVLAVASAAAFLVLLDGSGLARYVKFPGAPLMTLLLIVLLVRHLRRRAAPAGESVGAGGP